MPESAVRAWAPGIPGIREVLHARFLEHAYPSHTHAAWTVLIIDEGMVRYGLHRGEHGALRSQVTVLPPHVPHDGRNVTERGFRKRVLYLEPSTMDESLIGAAVDQPGLRDPLLRQRVHELHEVLRGPREPWHAQSRLALITERLAERLHGGPAPERAPVAPKLAGQLRELLDASAPAGITLDEAPACCTPILPTWCACSAPGSVSRRTATSPDCASTSRAGCCSTGCPPLRSPWPPGSPTSPI